MLRLRLLYGLLTIILLLWGVGAAAIILLRDSNQRFEERLKSTDLRYRDAYRPIDAAQMTRTLTATLNSNYLPSLAGPPTATPPDRALYEKLKGQLQEQLAIMHASASNDERWTNVLVRLDQVFDSYYAGFEKFLREGATASTGRAELLQFMSTQTLRLTDLTESVMTLSEEEMFSARAKIRDDVAKNSLFVITFVLVGTFVAVLFYFQLIRHLVDPVSALRRSIEEVRMGNFELTLPHPGRGSEFSRVVSAFNDMAAELRSRRRQSDETLSRATLVNSAILEAIPSPVFVLNDESGILQINPAAEKLTENLGVTGRLPLKIQRILEECRKTSGHFLPEDPREALLFRINEEEFYYLPRIFRFGSEKQSGWAVLLHNVTRIRWLDDVKTNLLATVSHEIKTPLTGIRMVLHLLLEERKAKLDDMQRLMVTSANEDCERLLATLNTLLDLSRAENGATHLACVPTSLADAVSRSARLYAATAEAAGVSLKTEPGPENQPEVCADPLRLDEVLNNLVSNAIKHSPRGGTVTLRISKPDAEYLRVTVIDEGPGVPEESQSRIFERFYRAPDQKGEGIGLGLFISREIMRAHEGRIGLLERTSNLTEFYIDVPIA